MKIIITETQFQRLVENRILLESIFEVESLDEFKQEIKKLVRRLLLTGLSITAICAMLSNYCDKNNIPDNVKQEALASVQQEAIPQVQNDWKLVDSNTIATVYNAIPAQCNGDFGHTASMFTLNLDNVLSHRIIAMERTFMAKLGLKYGDVVKIEGTDGYDGVWQIQDTMNKRFKGMHKIDILVPNNIKYGQWDNVKLYKLTNPELSTQYKSKMAGEISEELNKKQMKRIRKELAAKKKMQQNKKRSKK